MIQRPIPLWMFFSLAAAGVLLAVVFYAYLSVQQTRQNEAQSVIPGLSGLAEGMESIFQSRGSEKNPKSSWFVRDFTATYYRLLLGLSAGVIGSVLIGIAMGAYTAAEAFFSPVVNFMAKVPPTAMLVVYMVVFGIELKMYVALVGFGVFFTMVQSTYQSVKKDVARDLIFKAYTLGASELEIVIEVIWRQILPRVLESIRVHIGPAIVFLIAAEMLFASEGFGYTIRMESKKLNMNVVYIYLAILGTTGLILDWLLLAMRRRLCPWFGE